MSSSILCSVPAYLQVSWLCPGILIYCAFSLHGPVVRGWPIPVTFRLCCVSRNLLLLSGILFIGGRTEPALFGSPRGMGVTPRSSEWRVLETGGATERAGSAGGTASISGKWRNVHIVTAMSNRVRSMGMAARYELPTAIFFAGSSTGP